MAGEESSGGSLNVSLEHLEQVSAYVRRVAQEIAIKKKALDREANDVLLGSWTGALANQVREGWDEWELGFRALTDALDQSGELLAAARAGYETQENASASTISSISVDKKLSL